MTSGSMVSSMRDSPRVVRDQEGRVQDPTNGIVDRLGLRVGLVTALVSNDPDTRHDETLGETVQGPSCKSRDGSLDASADIRSQGGSTKVDGLERRVDVAGGVTQQGDEDQVLGQVKRRLDSRSFKAVLWDGREEVLDGKVGDVELVELVLVVGLGLSVRHLDGLTASGRVL